MNPENQQMRLVTRPTGIPQPEHFALIKEPLPRIDDGQMLVRNHYLSVDPAQRGWANDEGNYSAPIPLNTPMRALAVGEVIESRAPGFLEGEFIYGWFGWQSFCAATPDAVLRRVDPSKLPLSANLSLLGINGLTAYLAFNGFGNPRPGDHVLVIARQQVAHLHSDPYRRGTPVGTRRQQPRSRSKMLQGE